MSYTLQSFYSILTEKKFKNIILKKKKQNWDRKDCFLVLICTIDKKNYDFGQWKKKIWSSDKEKLKPEIGRI